MLLININHFSYRLSGLCVYIYFYIERATQLPPASVGTFVYSLFVFKQKTHTQNRNNTNHDLSLLRSFLLLLEVA